MSDRDRGATDAYGRGARVLSVGIATTGLVTFAFFAIAAQVLDPIDYAGVALLWSVLFVVVSVLYRPVEQLVSRSVAERRALGAERHSLRVPVALQALFALAFLAVALPLRTTLVEDVFSGADALFWVLVGAVVAYAASYLARGWLAGGGHFGLYGGLVLFESLSRLCFPLAVAVGIASGQTAVALGILAAPVASLLVVPWALARRYRAASTELDADADAAARSLTLRAGGGFALGVLAVQAAEQTLLNAPVLVADAVSSNPALAGIVFNVLLITRAPLQLFQAVQTSLLPHLTGLGATGEEEAAGRAVRTTLLAVAAFAAVAALVLLAVGPTLMELVFGADGDYPRGGLVLVAVGMGFHLAAGTLTQLLLARGSGARAAAGWALAAVVLLVFLALPLVDDVLLRVEAGYAGAAALLFALLGLSLRRRV